MTSEYRTYMHDPNLSLKEKLQRHLKEKNAAKKDGGRATDPVFLNRWGPWVLLFLLCGAGGWGTVVAMPVLYAGWWPGWLVLGRMVVGVMVVEAAVNWSLTRWVSSEYKPHLHGTQPPDGDDGQITDASEAGAVQRTMAVSEENSLSVKRDQRVHRDCEQRSSSADNFPSDTIQSSRDDAGAAKPPSKSRSYDGYSYLMWVAVALPTAEGRIERKSFPYWSWVKCLMCQRPRPPRCHHCTLCQVCVLKRDHHCYLTGSCIGVNNHRFFLLFLFWGMLLSLFGTLHMLPYTFIHVIPDYNVSVFDFIPPISLLRGLLGHVSLVIFVLAFLFWLLLFFVGMAIQMLINFLYMFVIGKTSFERDNSIKVTDTRSLIGKLRSVFGDYWWINILVPTYPWITPDEDAVYWPHIKPC